MNCLLRKDPGRRREPSGRSLGGLASAPRGGRRSWPSREKSSTARRKGAEKSSEQSGTWPSRRKRQRRPGRRKRRVRLRPSGSANSCTLRTHVPKVWGEAGRQEPILPYFRTGRSTGYCQCIGMCPDPTGAACPPARRIPIRGIERTEVRHFIAQADSSVRRCQRRSRCVYSVIAGRLAPQPQGVPFCGISESGARVYEPNSIWHRRRCLVRLVRKPRDGNSLVVMLTAALRIL